MPIENVVDDRNKLDSVALEFIYQQFREKSVCEVLDYRAERLVIIKK